MADQNKEQFDEFVTEGDNLADIGKFDLALEKYEQALELRNDDPDVNCSIGSVYAEKGDFEL